MESNYKILLSNKHLVKEVELPAGIDALRIGTGLNCDVRMRKELFFEQFDISLFLQNGSWQVRCSPNIYIASGDVQKLLTCSLKHGTRIAFKYNAPSAQGSDFLTLDFMLDFERAKKDYDRRVDITDIISLSIGGKATCDIYCHDSILSDISMTLCQRGGDYYVADNATTYGVYLNGNRIQGEVRLKNFDFVSLAQYSFYYKHRTLYCSAGDDVTLSDALTSSISRSSASAFTYPQFNRSTRIKPQISNEPLTILDPPQKPQKQSANIFQSLLPILAMVIVVVVMRGVMSDSAGGSFIWMSVAMMSIGAITSIVTFVSGTFKFKKDTRQRAEKYHAYIKGKRKEFEVAREEELSVLNELHRSQEGNLRAVDEFGGELFDRTRQDDDFLSTKLGQGALKAIRPIAHKQKESFDTADELMQIPEEIAVEYESIADGPVTVSLKDCNALGIIGNWKAQYDILKNMTVDIGTRHYYSDVKFFYIVDERYAKIFQWLRFLPHASSAHGERRNIAYDAESRMALYEHLYQEFSKRESAGDDAGQTVKCVIFVFDDQGFKLHPVSNFVGIGASIGATFVFFETTKEQLPLYCDRIISVTTEDDTSLLSDEGSAHLLSHAATVARANLLISADRNDSTEFEYEVIDDEVAKEVAIKLAPVYCEEVSLEGSLTKNITLFELLRILGVEDVDLQQRWASSQITKSMAAPLGIKSEGEVVALDLHEKAHGPHGLIAGTTGSGKSEILQSYILSAATLFHPHDTAFVIIDFKGGGMANQFMELPHLVGAITNIDGKEIDRSLLSIKAELRKRQSLFAQADVNHIDKYIVQYKSGKASVALPHLVIVVDEFAELKAEQPDFMNELISTARIGRSLGVHLILATQKPAGQVNEQIWSNSRFKLCLKVQTKEDSNEVLKSPLAAEIREAGRAYFQVGNNEIFELFQSAYSGAPQSAASDGGTVREFYLAQVDLAGRKQVVYAQKPEKREGEDKTQLDALVGYVAQFCKERGIERLPAICLPPLALSLAYPDGQQTGRAAELWDFALDIGRYDDPHSQYQGAATIDIAESNTIIIGSAQYGKTNLLQSMIRSLTARYAPDEVVIYILDFASMVLKTFEGLHHVGGVVTSQDDEKLKNLFKLLNEEIAQRKEKLLALGVSSFAAYQEAGKTDLPLIVLMVDNLTIFKELYLQEDDFFLPVCREGISVGISIVVANAQTSGIGYRYLSSFANRIALYNNDSSEYNNLFDYCRMQPENTPGRCLLSIDKQIHEAQTYVAFEGEREIDRARAIHQFVAERNAAHLNVQARKIPEIPRALTEDYLGDNYHLVLQLYQMCIGLDYETVSPVKLSLDKIGLMGVLAQDGGNSSGDDSATAFVKRLIREMLSRAQEAPVLVEIIDNFERAYEDMPEFCSDIHYTTLQEDILAIVKRCDELLGQRYAALLAGKRDALVGEPLVLLVINNADAVKTLSNNAEAFAKFKDIFTRYKALKVAVLCTALENAPITYGAPEVYKAIKESGSFIYFGDLAAYKVADPSYSDLKRFKKAIERGDAYWLEENALTKIKTVT